MTSAVLNCGYVPLVDCAPLVIARELGFAAEEGLDLCLIKQPSWSALRDMLAFGHLDAAHMLSPMPVAMSLGMGGLAADIDALMVLSVNGTCFGVSNQLADELGPVRFGDAIGVLAGLSALPARRLRIGVPFPFSMHRLLLSYWTAAAPDLDVEPVTIPPQRMADALSDGHIDAFWVGEPWGSAAVQRGVGQLLLAGRDVWAFAPEKVLAARTAWVTENPHLVGKLMRAIFIASRWLDVPENKPLAVEILGRSEHIDLAHDLLEPALSWDLTPVHGKAPVHVPNFMVFHQGAAQFPWRSQAAWIAAQLGADDAGIAQAKRIWRSDLYRTNLGPIGADLPGASEKLEGAMHVKTAVSSSKGHMILGPDAMFDRTIFDPSPK